MGKKVDDNPFDDATHYPASRAPTLFAFLLLILGWLANQVALAWVHDRVPRGVDRLPDLFFSFVPEVPGAMRIAEYAMLFLTANAALVVALHRHRSHVARRVFFCAALAYLFRALCITLIQMPEPSPHTYCAPAEQSGFSIVLGRVMRTFWSAGIQQLRPNELCGDLIVSGHTLTIITSLFTFKQYAPRNLEVLGHFNTALAAIALSAILLQRIHYTIDVLLGYMVASRMFMEYHALMQAYHAGVAERSPLWGCFWSRLIPFLEEDAPPPHLFCNTLEWPSSCPARLNRWRNAYSMVAVDADSHVV